MQPHFRQQHLMCLKLGYVSPEYHFDRKAKKRKKKKKKKCSRDSACGGIKIAGTENFALQFSPPAPPKKLC